MRLTNEIRDTAIAGIIKKKITGQIEKLREEVVLIAQDEANKKYKGKVKEWIDSSPKGGLMLNSNFYLTIKDKFFYHELFGSGRWGNRKSHFKIKKSIKVLKQDEYDEDLIVSEKSKNGKRLKSICLKLDKIEEQKNLLEKTIRSALYGCTTRKQLVDNYPDLAVYVPLREKETKALIVTSGEVKKALSV